MKVATLLSIVAILTLAIAPTLQADDEGGLFGDSLKDKFKGVELSPQVDAPPTTPSSPTTPTEHSPGEVQTDAATKDLPNDIVDALWKMIDANQNRQATDREVMAAIKKLRVMANSKTVTNLRDQVREQANTDDDPLLTTKEAGMLLARVRGVRCPTAKRAEEFFNKMDTNESGKIENNEIAATLSPLGAVGRYLFVQLSPQFMAMDVDRSRTIDLNEAYFSANSLYRIQLATEGASTAQKNPKDWFRFVNAIAYLDVDSDNKVSRREAASVGSVASAFNQIDRDQDQLVSLSELCAYSAKLNLASTSGG